MADEETKEPSKRGIFKRVWGFISEHSAIVLGAVAGLGVIYYLYSSSQASQTGTGNPSSISFPPVTGGGGVSGGDTTTAPLATVTPTVATPTLSTWLAGISPSLLTDTASWQSLQSWLTGQSSSVTAGAAALYNQLVATYGAAPNISGLPSIAPAVAPIIAPIVPPAPAFVAPNPPTGFFTDLTNRLSAYGTDLTNFSAQFNRTTSQYLNTNYAGESVVNLWSSLYGSGQKPDQNTINNAVIAFLNNPANTATALPIINPQASLPAPLPAVPAVPTSVALPTIRA